MRAIKAQEGPTAAAVRVQTAAMREPLYHPAALGCALSCVLAANRPGPGTSSGRSRHVGDEDRRKELLSPTTCAVTREGMWCGYMGRWLG